MVLISYFFEIFDLVVDNVKKVIKDVGGVIIYEYILIK